MSIDGLIEKHEASLAEKDQQIAALTQERDAWQRCRDECERQYQQAMARVGELTQENVGLRERNTQLETYLRETVEPYKYFDGMAWCWPFSGRTPKPPSDPTRTQYMVICWDCGAKGIGGKLDTCYACGGKRVALRGPISEAEATEICMANAPHTQPPTTSQEANTNE